MCYCNKITQADADDVGEGSVCLSRFGAKSGAIQCRGGILLPAVFNNSLMRSLNVCVLSSVLMARRTFQLAGQFTEGQFAEDW